MAVDQVSLDVLLVEDNPGDARLVEHHLNAPHVADFAGDTTIHHVDTLSAALTELEDGNHDVLFLDLGLPESTGLETLDRTLATEPELPIVVLTGLDDREIAVNAIQRGAQDYLLKDELDADILARSLRYAVERHQQEEQLRRKNEHLDDFASVVSHDLRNPLNVANGRLDIARQEHNNEHLTTAARALDRMERLIEDLLTLARQGDTVDELAPVDLEALCRACWRDLETANATVRIETDQVVYADESRLHQLLENLFHNAVEHGGRSVTVTVDDLANGFYIEDDGTGLPADVDDAIFESGYSTAEEGTGFGLMIVERIVAAHDWTITATNGEQGGARFAITGVESPS
ncbi:MAG: hybrid sensor histidine kinase/response regulator [Halobacteriales archaeon]|nr:hybrid sensor histidine kinase/response regulator [Halobacteriales archaeon]